MSYLILMRVSQMKDNIYICKSDVVVYLVWFEEEGAGWGSGWDFNKPGLPTESPLAVR